MERFVDQWFANHRWCKEFLSNVGMKIILDYIKACIKTTNQCNEQKKMSF